MNKSLAGSLGTAFAYDGDQIIGEINSDGTIGRAYLWGPTGLELAVDKLALGDPVTLAFSYDPSGNRVGRHPYRYLGSKESDEVAISQGLYDGFGRMLLQTNFEPIYPSDPNQDPIGYKGQVGCYSDYESGLVYCHHRYYSPDLGRWLTRDPIGADGGINVYEFCGNNPIMGADPSGLQGPGGATVLERAVEDEADRFEGWTIQTFGRFWRCVSGAAPLMRGVGTVGLALAPTTLGRDTIAGRAIYNTRHGYPIHPYQQLFRTLGVRQRGRKS